MIDLESRTALIENIKTFFLPRKEIVLAYLYGSFAKGASHPHSDVDVAILLDESISVERYPYGYRSELIADLMKLLRTNRIDLVVMNNASPFLKFQVVRYGLLILARSEAERIDFHVKTIAKYNDIKPLLDIQHKYLSDRLKSGTFGKR